jgi:hypothetical protein
MALKRAVLVRPKNVGELWTQMAGLSVSGWDPAGLAMRAAVTGGRGATEIFPVRWVVLLKSFRRSLAGFGRRRLGLLCVDRAMRTGAELVDASDSGAVGRARASRRSLEE